MKAGKVEAFPFQYIMTTLGGLNDDSSLLKGGRRGRLYKKVLHVVPQACPINSVSIW